MADHDFAATVQSRDEEPPRLRSADFVMSEGRAAAAYPNALSFSRSFIRKMQREGWRIATERLELDIDGRGEALYRVSVGEWECRALMISDYFPPTQKVDRAFGINWDVSAAVCQGVWTSEREAKLRGQIPKQYDGRYDDGVLCFCRGNRSERIFDHVVERLADGVQPDVALLSTVGYLFRSTAFVGNGLFGMAPFSALGENHPLGATYHAQMLAAYMLRHFVFDLVETMASKRNAGAGRLERRVKRYLGVGNSAGLGLVPFIANHPQLVHQWTLSHEKALAAAGRRIAACNDPATSRFFQLLGKACRYFGEEERDGNGIFASYDRLAKELEAARIAARHFLDINSNGPKRRWAEIIAAATPDGAHLETVEIISSILIELYPDIIASHETGLHADERTEVASDLTVGDLQRALERNYSWLLDSPLTPEVSSKFWYYPYESPYEPRRGLRAQGGRYTVETAMDLPVKVRQLATLLAACDPDQLVGEFTASRPDLSATAKRILTLDGLEYAELRTNTLAERFLPFAACRFLLAFYGMEKYDPRPPRSTKGALMQGAPLADELAPGHSGDWPFPLAPDLHESSERPQVQKPLRLVESPEISIKALQKTPKGSGGQSLDAAIRLFPPELTKLLRQACFASGIPLGISDGIRAMVESCEACSRPVLTALADNLLSCCAAAKPVIATPHVLDARGLPDFAVATTAIDLAFAQLRHGGVGAIMVDRTVISPLLFAAPLHPAARNSIVAVADMERNEVFLAGPGKEGLWHGCFLQAQPEWATAVLDGKTKVEQIVELVKSRGLLGLTTLSTSGGPSAKNGRVVCLCIPTNSGIRTDEDAVRMFAQDRPQATFISSPQLNQNRSSLQKGGIYVDALTFNRIKILSSGALVPEDLEHKLSA